MHLRHWRFEVTLCVILSNVGHDTIWVVYSSDDKNEGNQLDVGQNRLKPRTSDQDACSRLDIHYPYLYPGTNLCPQCSLRIVMPNSLMVKTHKTITTGPYLTITDATPEMTVDHIMSILGIGNFVGS